MDNVNDLKALKDDFASILTSAIGLFLYTYYLLRGKIERSRRFAFTVMAIFGWTVSGIVVYAICVAPAQAAIRPLIFVLFVAIVFSGSLLHGKATEDDALIT